MDEAFRLRRYLSVSFRNVRHIQYVNHLWDSFEMNYENGSYSFAGLSVHLLFMISVYCKLWQIRIRYADEFEDLTRNLRDDVRREVKRSTTPFGYSLINEKRAFEYMKIIQCCEHTIKEFKNLVDTRNGISHANGAIMFETRDDLDDHIETVVHSMDRIQSLADPLIESLYIDFPNATVLTDEPEYLEPEDQVREIFIYDNHLSLRDIETCLGIELAPMNMDEQFAEIRSLHRNLKQLHDSFTDG